MRAKMRYEKLRGGGTLRRAITMFYDMAVVVIILERLQVWSYVPKRFFAVKNENGIACLQEEKWHRPMSLNTTFCGHSFVRQCAVTDICYVVICVVMSDVFMLWLWVRYICGRSNLFLSDPRYIQGYDIRAGLELVTFVRCDPQFKAMREHLE